MLSTRARKLEMKPDKKANKSNNSNSKRRVGSCSNAHRKTSATRVSKPQPSKTGGAHAGGVRKLPRQERSAQMVAAVLEAAAEIFANLGYARTTTNKIAERAGVSVGSLYQYFPNKDSLLSCLLARHHADVHEIVDRSLNRLGDPTCSLEKGLRRLLEELVQLHRKNPKLTRALATDVLRESPAIDEAHKRDGADALNAQLATVLSARPDVRAGDRTAMAAVLGQTTAQLTRWLVHDAPAGVDREELLEEVIRLLLRYLCR